VNWDGAIQHAENGEKEPEMSNGDSDLDRARNSQKSHDSESIADLDNSELQSLSSPELPEISKLFAEIKTRPRPQPTYKGAAKKPFCNPYTLGDSSDNDRHARSPVHSPTTRSSLSTDPESPTPQTSILFKGKGKATMQKRSHRVMSVSDRSDSKVEINTEGFGAKGKGRVSMVTGQDGTSQTHFICLFLIPQGSWLTLHEQYSIESITS
jgi:hypothetical protein